MSADHQTLIAEALCNTHPVTHGMPGDVCPTCTNRAAALLDSPEFAAVLADVRAGAWDEGAFAVFHDPRVDNPYRADERTSHE